MGILISRFRTKPSTKELLEDLEKEIETLEEYKRSTELQQKAVVRSLIFYSLLLYVVAAGIFLFYSFPTTTKDRILYCAPLLIFPILLYILKKFLHWYFLQKIRSNDENLIELKKRKKSLLEFAMETETYKVVKELLERFDPDVHRKIFESRPAITAAPSRSPLKGSYSDTELRRRNISPKSPPIPLGPPGTSISPGQMVSFNTPAGPQVFPFYPGKSPTNPPYPPAYYPRVPPPFVRPPGNPMPRPVLPRERSLMDKFVDYIVGDGPTNRYALICRQCQSHNGMALREEFEFIAFRCCYCFTWNPPRSQHPPPPRLSLPAPPPSAPPAIADSPVSDVSSSSAEETEVENLSDVENKPIEDLPERDSTSEQPAPDRQSISSKREIEADLEEDRPYLASSTSEPELIEVSNSENTS